MNAPVKEIIGVLMVDDSVDDRLFLRIVLETNPRLKLVGEVFDGEDAVSYLSGAGKFSNRTEFPFPHVVFLDLKMPRMTGFDVLTWLRVQPFEKPVVIVVSGSLLPDDISKSLALGAVAYHRKVMLKDEQDALFREIEESLAARGSGSSAVQPAA